MSAVWRTGRKVGRTLYRDDVLVGLLDMPELAQSVAAAMNSVADGGRSDGRHCDTCICGRRAPVQGNGMYVPQGDPRFKGAGTITWAEHLEAYAAYAERYGRSQSAERLAERGGFSHGELTELLGHEPKTWEPRR